MVIVMSISVMGESLSKILVIVAVTHPAIFDDIVPYHKYKPKRQRLHDGRRASNVVSIRNGVS